MPCVVWNHGDSEYDILKKILESEGCSYDRLAQILAATAAGGGGGGGAVDLTAINGVAPSVGNGVSGTGVLRVSQVSDGTGILASVTLNSDVRQATASNFNAQAVGNVAHDAVDAGNPVKSGAVAIAHGTNPTAVAAADRTNLYANRAGVPFVIGGHPNVITRRDNYTAAQTDTAIVTVAGGSKIVVVGLSVLCANSNTVDVNAMIGFGAATTPTGVGVVLSHPGLAKGSGFTLGNGAGILGVGADGEDLRITSTVPTTGSISVITKYYTIES